MPKKSILTDQAPKPVGPYAQAIQVGNFVFVSGQIGINPETSKIVAGQIQEQTIQALENITNILRSVDMNLRDVVKVSVFLKDISDFESFNTVYKEYFAEDPPARTTVQANLVRGALVEIAVIASSA